MGDEIGCEGGERCQRRPGGTNRLEDERLTPHSFKQKIPLPTKLFQLITCCMVELSPPTADGRPVEKTMPPLRRWRSVSDGEQRRERSERTKGCRAGRRRAGLCRRRAISSVAGGGGGGRGSSAPSSPPVSSAWRLSAVMLMWPVHWMYSDVCMTCART